MNINNTRQEDLLDEIDRFDYGQLGDPPGRVCPVIAMFVRGVSFTMADAERQRLKVFIPRLIGTIDPQHEVARAMYLTWQAVRVFAPRALDAAGLYYHGIRLREFRRSLADAAPVAIEAARDARAAARKAARAGWDARSVEAGAAAEAAIKAWSAVRTAQVAIGAVEPAIGFDTARAARYAAATAASAVVSARTAAGAEAADATLAALDGVLRIGRCA